jgi:hypothetical protein
MGEWPLEVGMLPVLVALGLAGVVAATSSTEPSRKVLPVYLVRGCLPMANCLPIRIVTRMKYETERIWSPLDVQIAWIDSMEARPAAASAGLTVMLEERSYPQWVADRDFLLAGLHQPADQCGRGLARVWVRHVQSHVAAVRRDGHPFDTLPTALADMLLARALGRALAHEIGHYLLGTAEHSAHGLMRASFAPQDLLEDAIRPLYGLNSHERATLVSCRTVPPADRAVVNDTPSWPPAGKKPNAATRRDSAARD